MNRELVILVCGVMGFAPSAHALGVMSPEDEAVSAYLEEHGLDDLLEVQLFDRIQRADAGSVERIELADRLARVYLEAIGRDGIGDPELRRVLVKGQVLAGLVPNDSLIELRLALLIERFKEHERSADVFRIGLLGEDDRQRVAAELRVIGSGIDRIGKLSAERVDAARRDASRAAGEELIPAQEVLANAREIRSRAAFFGAWAGYSGAVLSGKRVADPVLEGFGTVLGFDESIPVLDRLDRDLLEYEHVARAMIGVALCKLQNGELSESRVWLSALAGSGITPEHVVDLARQRLLEVSLNERDWVQSIAISKQLGSASPESLLGVAQARLMVISALTVKQDGDGRGGYGIGGQEGVGEVARVGLDRLVELGEIGHVLELRERFGELPVMETGFVGQYVQGIEALGRGEEAEDEHARLASYRLGAEKLRGALESDDASAYRSHAGDAVLKLALCRVRLEQPARAVGVIEEFGGLLEREDQLEEALWLQILALDSAVGAGQDQMGDRLAMLVQRYIEEHRSTERANTLIVRYAMTPYLGIEDAMGALEINDASDPLAITARRKLIQLIYKNPSLVTSGLYTQADKSAKVYETIAGHARWVWSNEPRRIEDLREARERLTVCRIVLGTGVVVDGVESRFLRGVVDRGESIVDSYRGLGEVSSELAFRRVQLLLMDGEVDRAGEIVLSGVLDESVESVALLMVFDAAFERLRESSGVDEARSVMLYGRRVLDGTARAGDERLSSRVSIVGQQVAVAAESLHRWTGDESMLEYAGAVSVRVFEHGVPTFEGILRAAVHGERMGRLDVALDAWLMLVTQIDESDIAWHRARYESLRLLMESDPDRGRAVYRQYAALYPGGSPEPWGSRIDALFGVDRGGGQP